MQTQAIDEEAEAITVSWDEYQRITNLFVLKLRLVDNILGVSFQGMNLFLRPSSHLNDPADFNLSN